MNDLISREYAINDLKRDPIGRTLIDKYNLEGWLRGLPSAQREPISEAYAETVRAWLVCYQLKCAELKGRYTPYEVLGWIVNDWGKEFGE